MNLWIRMVILAGTCLLLSGCASQSSTDWQDSIVDFIDREGGGDPAVLRRLANDRGQIVFHHLGSQEGLFEKHRTDIDGMLIAAERLGEANWLIFLIATVRYAGGTVDTSWDYPHVQQMHAAAMRVDDGANTWRTGPVNEDATAQYVQWQLDRWHATRNDERKHPVTRFPTERDRFTTDRAGSVVTITDQHTGARWQVDLADPTG